MPKRALRIVVFPPYHHKFPEEVPSATDQEAEVVIGEKWPMMGGTLYVRAKKDEFDYSLQMPLVFPQPEKERPSATS